MSGGVDSSVAAALVLGQGHEVVGATMKLWGGLSDSGCCSVADVEDARRVAQQLGIDHHVFNFTSEFEHHVVGPYVEGHSTARTPNPCIACNAHLKFDAFLTRAVMLGFDAIATGHHARVTPPGAEPGAPWLLRRGHDQAKDQSYVLYMLGQYQLAHLLLPIGELTKEVVRQLASEIGLRTATKPDSQDVCFISRATGREGFLGDRIPVRPGRLVTTGGEDVGHVEALELVTVGQRRGLGFTPRSKPERRFVLEVDLEGGTATVGGLDELLVDRCPVSDVTWAAGAPPGAGGADVAVQMSAHGRPVGARWAGDGAQGAVLFDEPVRRVAPGQAVVIYQSLPDGDAVLGGGVAV
jgi:tRNA-uridine 2-sulfurtransferase